MSAKQAIQLAETLPPRLLRFFQRFPPPQLVPNAPSVAAASASASAVPGGISSPQAPAVPSTSPEVPTLENAPSITSSHSATAAQADPADPADAPYHNPFAPRKNFRTGTWYGPVYGLRQQADLVKLAQRHGVLDLLPHTIKKPGEKERRRVERGLRVKGTGVGERVKGKKWERTLKGRLEERRRAMLDMPRLIQEWKQKGHGRGWRKWPK